MFKAFKKAGAAAKVVVPDGSKSPPHHLPGMDHTKHTNSLTYSSLRLHGQVAHEIGMRILSGEIAPGDILPAEAALSAERGISRTVMREAVKILAAKGLVESRPKRGTIIRPRAIWNMLDPDVISWWVAAGRTEYFVRRLFELRRIVEPSAAAMAAQQASASAIKGIQNAYETLEREIGRLDTSISPDVAFHLSILNATNNELLRSLGALIGVALGASFKISSSRRSFRRKALPLHRAVLESIRSRDAEGARAAMYRLLGDAYHNFQRVMVSQRNRVKRGSMQQRDSRCLSMPQRGGNGRD
jgi:DNA-binding FadR family transcriptional regulator